MLISAGEHRLYFEIFGRGRATVVFDAGLGDSSGQWGVVPAQVAEFARVCIYDRAGLGQSQAGPQPRTSRCLVEELHAALTRAGITPPYILVGHSFGGQNVRLYASSYPEEVVGLVLVDAHHPELAHRFAMILTPQQQEQFLAGWKRNREGVDLLASDAEMVAAAPVPAIPLVVIARGKAPRAEDFPPAWPIAALEEIWQELQGQLASTHPNGTLWRADLSGHYIQRDEPALVVAAIREVLNTIHSQHSP